MVITFCINLVNIFLDYSLIFGNFGFPRLGAIGSAVATTAARAIGSALILYVLFRRRTRQFLRQLRTARESRVAVPLMPRGWYTACSAHGLLEHGAKCSDLAPGRPERSAVGCRQLPR